MTPGFDRLRRSAAACAIATAVCASNAPAAEDASAWNGDSRGAVRLIAGSWSDGQAAPLRAGVEIRLKPGWHTYWRYPGDAGVPPRFDFSGSRNLKALHMLWPAPRRIREHGLSVIGYTKDVILPLIIVPQDRAAPVTLRLAIDYAVCETLCLPQQAIAELVLAPGQSSRDAALAQAQARVPRKQTLGEGSPLAVRAIRREEGSRSRAVIDVQAPPGASVDVLAEGPTSDWALPLPTVEGGSPAGLQRFAFDLDGAPPGAKYEGALVTITAITADDAIEVSAPLD